MKKVIIIVAILIAVVIAGAVVVSILIQPDEIRLSGTYSNETKDLDPPTGSTLVFDEEKVVATYKSAGIIAYTVTGTYTIEEGILTMTFNDPNVEINLFEGRFTFEKGEGYILIDGIRYYSVNSNAE